MNTPICIRTLVYVRGHWGAIDYTGFPQGPIDPKHDRPNEFKGYFVEMTVEVVWSQNGRENLMYLYHNGNPPKDEYERHLQVTAGCENHIPFVREDFRNHDPNKPFKLETYFFQTLAEAQVYALDEVGIWPDKLPQADMLPPPPPTGEWYLYVAQSVHEFVPSGKASREVEHESGIKNLGRMSPNPVLSDPPQTGYIQ